MAAFAQAFSATQADDGTVTYHDDSTWASNDENYHKEDFVRQIVLTDAYGVLLDTLVFATDSLIVTYALTTNKWIQSVFSITGAANFSLTHKDPFQRIYEVAYIKTILPGCGCKCGNKGPNLCEVDAFDTGSTFAIIPGDGVSYQNYIDSAYKLLTV